MSRVVLQDMVRSKPSNIKKKSDLSVRGSEKKMAYKKEEKENLLTDSSVKVASFNKKNSRYYLWIVAFISAVFCFFAISFLFASAKIIVDPKTKELNINKNFLAEKNKGATNLSFDMVVVEGEESKNINATEEKELAKNAIGVAVIYNAFSAAPQTLNIDTRLEGSNGKMYKTEKKIVVPGIKKDGTPGSIEVGIYASSAGEDYNSEPLDFKIFGFKGTPKYEKFYGRSKGKIAGGFVGKTMVLSEGEKTLAINSLTESLKEKLLKKAGTPDFVLFKEAVFFNVDEVEIPPEAKDGKVSVSVKGTLKGILFNKEKLTKKIAESGIEKYDGSDIYLEDFNKLNFSLSNDTVISPESTTSINFNLSGLAKIIYKIDTDKFISSLMGEPKDNFVKILSEYPNIESAILRLRFPWMQNIPGKREDINVIVNYPK